jgi:hypothetical protein
MRYRGEAKSRKGKEKYSQNSERLSEKHESFSLETGMAGKGRSDGLDADLLLSHAMRQVDITY